MEGLYQHADKLSGMVSSASVAAIGIMSAAVVLVTSGKDSYFLRWYKSCGAQANFVFYYLFTILCLFVTHTLSLFALNGKTELRMMLASTIMNTIQVMLIIVVSYRIHQKNEAHQG